MKRIALAAAIAAATLAATLGLAADAEAAIRYYGIRYN